MSARIPAFPTSRIQDWVQKAACAETGAPSMFPHDKDADDVRTCKRFCRRCPVQETCLEEAMRREEAYGIWGGLTPEERKSLRRRSTRRATTDPA